MLYLDHAATTPVVPGALEAAWPWLTSDFGNPSSTHELGLRAAAALNQARSAIAQWLEVSAHEIVFTSGGTEGDNLAIVGLASAHPRGRHIVSCRTEHEAVIESIEYLQRAHGFDVTWLPVSQSGHIELSDVENALRPDSTMVSLMVANNEIGTVHPIAEVSAIAHGVGALMHTDAVQAAPWLDIRPSTLGVDALTISGHKVGAPKGSGALFVRAGLTLEPLMHGGGQEDGRRSGTENVAWAVALATAISTSIPRDRERELESTRIVALRDRFLALVREGVPEAEVTGSIEQRLPSIASFVFDGLGGESLLLALEERGVIVSSGAACAAGRDDPSHVLVACGVDEDRARTSIRVSFSRATTEHDVTKAAAAFAEAASDLRKLSRSSSF